ncbi:MAG: MarR family winged helix-turn-helix transcriptional regulator [Acidimicrobiaceae bacterium]|nr:MarR family winged helix-turn-helix transcriptional regulator [Acidimicrobiaceae bacterium]
MTSSTRPDAAAPDAGSTVDEVTPPSLDDPDPLLLAAVRALARASRLLERASSELSLAHYRVLAAIASGDVRATRIAARLAVGKPAISAAVESLCQRGLLARSVVKGDQRAAALHLTPSGRAVLDRVEAEMTRQLSELSTHMPEPRQLFESLVWLDAAIEADLAERAATRGGTR